MTATLEYAPGRLLDVHGDPSPTTVLLWHGRGPNERHLLAPFADLIAEAGLRVVVPDWDSTADDGGRTDLLLSIKHVLSLNTPWLITGWSLGGAAAASLALNSRKLGLGKVPAVILAGGFTKEDPLSGTPFAGLTIPGRNQGSITLVHGTEDEIVAADGTRDFFVRLRDAGWSTELIELPTDHFGIVGTTHDVALGQCVPATDGSAARAAAGIVIKAATPTS